MPSFAVKVKWGRELFSGIEVDTDEEPVLLKAQLFALTGVLPDRQKIMFKGGILRDNEWNLQIKEGSTLVLLGTKEEVPEIPSAPVKFIEDMNDMELAAALDLPSGLTNLGNTCYMNATVQCLKSVPELCEALKLFELNQNDSGSLSLAITTSLQNLFKQMDKASTVTPIVLLQTLHKASPHFSETAENGMYRQQDANECWSELLKMLQQQLPPSDANKGEQSHQYKSFVEQYFGGTFEVKMICSESPEERTTCTIEQFLQLSCFISSEVKDVHSGLKSKMKEHLVKYSHVLDRDASFDRSYLISRLPAYLTIQFVRFQYKGKEGINAKILKDIKFPVDFDAYELCTPYLQEKLTAMRLKFKEFEEDTNFDYASQCDPEPINYWFDDDLGSNNSGFYTLKAVLTHKGRSSSSGHYVAWIRQKEDTWFKFDDDIVSSVTTEEILRLSGGGDWHCAYVLLYGPRVLKAINKHSINN